MSWSCCSRSLEFSRSEVITHSRSGVGAQGPALSPPSAPDSSASTSQHAHETDCDPGPRTVVVVDAAKIEGRNSQSRGRSLDGNRPERQDPGKKQDWNQ